MDYLQSNVEVMKCYSIATLGETGAGWAGLGGADITPNCLLEYSCDICMDI